MAREEELDRWARRQRSADPGRCSAASSTSTSDRARAAGAPTVSRLTGRPARTFRQWVEAHADELV